MSKAFLQLNASTVKSGLLQLNPTLAQEFKHVAETFSSLAKTASDGQSEGEVDGDGGEQVPEVQKPPEPEPEAQHIGWGYSDVSKTAAKVCSVFTVFGTGLIFISRNACIRPFLYQKAISPTLALHTAKETLATSALPGVVNLRLVRFYHSLIAPLPLLPPKPLRLHRRNSSHSASLISSASNNPCSRR
jgi:hypothetical protein